MSRPILAMLLIALCLNGCTFLRTKTMLTAEGRANPEVSTEDKWVNTFVVVFTAWLAVDVIKGPEHGKPTIAAPLPGTLPKCGRNEDPKSGKCIPLN